MRRVAERWQVADIGLPARAVAVEDHRMEVDPARGRRSELHPGRSPVGLQAVAEGLQGAEGWLESGVSDVEGEIEVAVDPSLSPGESIDAPASGDPCPQTDDVQSREHA
jgi:hypothetical protein